MNDPFAPIAGAPAAAKPSKVVWTAILPVPADARAPPTEHYKLGRPSARWRYVDAAGATLGFANRFDGAGEAGEKVFQPLIYAQRSDGKREWRWKSWDAPRPLYGLQALAQRPGAAVVITEGEKAADAAGELLPQLVAVTSPNGSKSATKADWSPLRGRQVAIWPDADIAGLEYAQAVAKLAIAAGAVSVAIVSPPTQSRKFGDSGSIGDLKTGWDAADALSEGWGHARAAALIAAAVPAHKFKIEADAKGEEKPDSGRKRGPPQRDILIGLTEFCELWHDAGSEAYVSFPVNDHRENWAIRSRSFRLWLTGRYYVETGSAIPSQALEEGIRVLEARALHEGPEYQPFLRTGHHNGNIYYDLCDAAWRVVEVGPHGWSVTDKSPVKFLRSRAMRALPEPEGGESIERLRRFINVQDPVNGDDGNESDPDFMMLVAWLLAAMRPIGPCPILLLSGEHGTAKSFGAKIVRSLIDPIVAPARRMPKDDRDMIVSAINAWVVAYDNVSFLEPWLSDGLCSLATGAGYTTRMLHTDSEELIFEGHRPIILNGISGLTDRPDLIDRSVTLNLRVIPEEARRPEQTMLREFDKEKPFILGALFDAMSAALRNYRPDDISQFKKLPRMADFAQFVTGAEPGLGWSPGSFIRTYENSRINASGDALEADAVAVAIRDAFTKRVSNPPPPGWEEGALWPPQAPQEWHGTPTQLLDLITSRVPERTSKTKSWPKTAQHMGNRFDRIAPLLRSKGFKLQRHHSTVRTIIIVPPPDHLETRQAL